MGKYEKYVGVIVGNMWMGQNHVRGIGQPSSKEPAVPKVHFQDFPYFERNFPCW